MTGFVLLVAITPLCIHHILLAVYPLRDTNIDFFFILAIVTSAAAIKIQTALQSMGVISLGYVATSRLAGSFVSSISSFGRKIVLFCCGLSPPKYSSLMSLQISRCVSLLRIGGITICPGSWGINSDRSYNKLHNGFCSSLSVTQHPNYNYFVVLLVENRMTRSFQCVVWRTERSMLRGVISCVTASSLLWYSPGN